MVQFKSCLHCDRDGGPSVIIVTLLIHVLVLVLPDLQPQLRQWWSRTTVWQRQYE